MRRLRVSRGSSISAIIACAILTACSGGGTSAPVTPFAPGSNGSSSTVPLNLYVPNSFNDIVTVYPATANGNVAPIRTLSGALTQLNRPFGIAFDSAGNMYVTNQIAKGCATAAITIYPPGASGNTAPIKTIVGTNTQLAAPRGIIIDATDTIYVANGNAVLVFAPGAQGNVAPIRTIAGPQTGISIAEDLALDSAGDIFVTESSPVNAIAEFAPGASGDTPPIATITGSATQLMDPFGIALSSTGAIYAGDFGACGTCIPVTIYAAGSNGNAAPSATLNNLPNRAAGVIFDASGDLYVSELFGPSQSSIVVFAPGATGNAAPIRTISGSSTQLDGPAFMTLHQ